MKLDVYIEFASPDSMASMLEHAAHLIREGQRQGFGWRVLGEECTHGSINNMACNDCGADFS